VRANAHSYLPIGLLLISVVLVTVVADAATLQVCPSGCPYTTIQAAVIAAQAGDTVQLFTTQDHIEADIQVDKSLTIEGMGVSTSTILGAALEGDAVDRVFRILSWATVTIRDLSIMNGVTQNGGGILNEGSLTLIGVRLSANHAESGGGIYNNGILTLENVELDENQAELGGGICVMDNGVLSMTGSSVHHNNCTWRGCGISTTSSAQLIVHDSDISNNSTGSSGGGLYNRGTATLFSTEVSSNTIDSDNPGANGSGGGILSDGTLSLRNCDVRGNEALGFTIGGGISLLGGTADLVGCTIAENSTQAFYGGGLMIGQAASNVTIDSTTISQNSSIVGGGLYVNSYTETRLTNTTISGNQALDDGGGLYLNAFGSVGLANVTVAENTADSDADNSGNGGGIFVEVDGTDQGSLRLRNTIVAGNFDVSPNPLILLTPDCDGPLISETFNLVGYVNSLCEILGDATGNEIGVSAELEPLADNGGPTPTHALGFTSPAVDGGNDTGCLDFAGTAIGVDQRLYSRPDRCDMGAFELAGHEPVLFADGFESGNTSVW
jgi:hypothetical protein